MGTGQRSGPPSWFVILVGIAIVFRRVLSVAGSAQFYGFGSERIRIHPAGDRAEHGNGSPYSRDCAECADALTQLYAGPALPGIHCQGSDSDSPGGTQLERPHRRGPARRRDCLRPGDAAGFRMVFARPEHADAPHRTRIYAPGYHSRVESHAEADRHSDTDRYFHPYHYGDCDRHATANSSATGRASYRDGATAASFPHPDSQG